MQRGLDSPEFALTCVDRRGRAIVLRQTRWLGHVLDRHRELAPHLSAIEATLTNPELVTRDKRHSDRENYFRPNLLPPPLHHLYLKVVVEFADDAAEPGIVITAYPVPLVPNGEVEIWR